MAHPRPRQNKGFPRSGDLGRIGAWLKGAFSSVDHHVLGLAHVMDCCHLAQPSEPASPQPPGCPRSPRSHPGAKRSNSSLIEQVLARAAPHRPRGEKRPIPNEQKDDKYFERRKRNNLAAKKSRDQRKLREDCIAIRAGVLEKENCLLRAHLSHLRDQRNALIRMLVLRQSHQEALTHHRNQPLLALIMAGRWSCATRPCPEQGQPPLQMEVMDLSKKQPLPSESASLLLPAASSAVA